MDKNERKDLMMDLFIDNENKASKLRCNNCNFSKDNEEVTCHCEIYDSAVLNDEGIHCMYNSAKEENEEMTKDIALGRFFTNDCLSTIRCGSCVFSSYNKLDLSLINNIDVKEQEQYYDKWNYNKKDDDDYTFDETTNLNELRNQLFSRKFNNGTINDVKCNIKPILNSIKESVLCTKLEHSDYFLGLLDVSSIVVSDKICNESLRKEKDYDNIMGSYEDIIQESLNDFRREKDLVRKEKLRQFTYECMKNYEKIYNTCHENTELGVKREKVGNLWRDDIRLVDDFDDVYYVNEEEQVVLNELEMGNRLKLAQQRLKKEMQKVSDKDKMISNQLDHAYDRFVYQIEKQMSNKNREAVIKGSLIPSLSSLIKLGTTSSLIAFFVNPLCAAITAFAGLAASKHATEKERKYILEEIDIQLEIIEKKLQLAESNNDMKAYEQLIRIQRQLQSERNRIVYKKRRSVVATKYN